MTRALTISALLVTLAACATVDADTRNTAVVAVDLSASTDLLSQRQTQVTGTIDLGYTDPGEAVDVEILDNGSRVYAETFASDAGSVALDATVDLLQEGANILTVLVHYEGQTVSRTLSVPLPSSLQGLELTPPADDPSSLSLSFSGVVDLGWTSDQDAVLSVFVDGQSALTRSLDASASTSIDFDATVPLVHEGPQNIEARVSYQGNTLAQTFSVTVPAGVQALSLTPPADPPAVLAVPVTGTAALGYTSDQPATLQVFVEGALAYSQSFDASTDPNLVIDTVVALPHPGENSVVAELSYGEAALTDAFVVTIADSVTDFGVTPASTTVDVYTVDVTGTATLGYTSDRPALFEVSVDGSPVLSQTLDVSTTTTPAIAATVPFAHDGPNEVVATLSYDGRVFTDSFTVDVVPPAPVVTSPTSWSTSFQGGVQLSLGGSTAVEPAPGWTVSGVFTSLDGGHTWVPATFNSATGEWDSVLVNPDIGTHGVLTRVDMVNQGKVQQTITASTYTLDPIFDCGNTGSMLPSSTLLQNNRIETRTMTGYFGDPAGGHSVSFAITARDRNGDIITTMANLSRYGSFAIEADFNVDRLRCNNQPCSVDYDLEVFADGVSLCKQNRFGRVESL